MRRPRVWLLAAVAVAAASAAVALVACEDGPPLPAWGERVARALLADDPEAGPGRDPAAPRDPDGHGGADAHGGEDETDEVALTAGQIALVDLRTAPVTRADVRVELPLTGEVTLNQDRLAHVAPRVPGVVREVRKNLGDRVRAGEVMAVIESRELADAKAAYLAARERVRLAEANFAREERLWKKKISSEQEYLDAKQALAEARIEMRSAGQKLHALGFPESYLARLSDHPGNPLTRYEIVSPIDGTVVAKHITLGEILDTEEAPYTVADLSNVWVLASVFEKDIARVALGQAATVTVRAHPGRRFRGTVTWVADLVDEETRTLKIRVEVDNPDRLLKPGMFARLALAVDTRRDVLTVPPSALQHQRGETVVFVDAGGGRFARREVKVGIRSADGVEIVAGLEEGERVVTDGGFILKSELEKTGFGGGHGH